MLSNQLQTTNPESLLYQNQLLSLTILGGIKLEGLDRMRVTLKICLNESSVPPVRHNLDLYNDTQLEKFIRKAAEKLEIGSNVIAASLAELTDQLEQYRLKQIKQQDTPQQYQPTLLTKEEKHLALDFLKSPNLLINTNKKIEQSGMIGEENNRLLMYLIFTSRKREQPLHIVSLGQSGSGKTYLQERIGDLIPEEDKIEITTLSENAFYYFGQRELKNKLILIEDLDGAENVLYPLRELQSKKKISKTIAHKNSKGETKTIHLIVEGPVSVSGCTTREHIYEDNANRSFLIYLDNSKEQDKRIMDYQRSLSARKISKSSEAQEAEFLKNTQRLLEPITVVNPFAELLSIPEEVLKPRRSNSHYLQFIEVVTFYHQFQRVQKTDKTTGEVYIKTSREDVEAANELLKDVLIHKSDELTGACRHYLESIKSHLSAENKNQFTNREIRKVLRVNSSNQKRYNLSLINNYYIKKVEGKSGTPFTYQVVSTEEYNDLTGRITSVLDENLKRIDQFTGSLPVHSQNEPLK